jgi:hypothetical protein
MFLKLRRDAEGGSQIFMGLNGVGYANAPDPVEDAPSSPAHYGFLEAGPHCDLNDSATCGS